MATKELGQVSAKKFLVDLNLGFKCLSLFYTSYVKAWILLSLGFGNELINFFLFKWAWLPHLRSHNTFQVSSSSSFTSSIVKRCL